MTIVRVIDFETTGFEPPVAEVCEVGYCDVDVESRSVGEYYSWLCGVREMPPEVRAVHHISLSECDGFPPFDKDTCDDDKVAVFAAHNFDFESKFFDTPKPKICTYKSALRVWPEAPSHSNGALRYWLEDQGLIKPDNTMTQPAHRAGPDAYVTGWLLVALLNSGATGKDMVAWTKEPKLMPKCTIGKFRGVSWAEVDEGFLGWVTRQADMDYDLKWNASREIKRRQEQ
jgi:exodeoxyribonuclease X